MPIDYKKYPKNWKAEIRPAALLRAENKCEFCKVSNSAIILRGYWQGEEVYQNCYDGYIYDAKTGEFLKDSFQDIDPDCKRIKVVLTIAHLNHDITDNRQENLKALCQKCHLTYDKEHHKQSRAKTLKKKKGNLDLF